MNTLCLSELTDVCGGIDPTMPDKRDLQWFLDQLAREQEAAFLRALVMECAD